MENIVPFKDPLPFFVENQLGSFLERVLIPFWKVVSGGSGLCNVMLLTGDQILAGFDLFALGRERAFGAFGLVGLARALGGVANLRESQMTTACGPLLYT